MENAKWRRLNAECSRALDRFLHEATRTCRMLAAMRAFPASLEERTTLVEQRCAEGNAFNAYLELRQQLMRMVADP